MEPYLELQNGTMGVHTTCLQGLHNRKTSTGTIIVGMHIDDFLATASTKAASGQFGVNSRAYGPSLTWGLPNISLASL